MYFYSYEWLVVNHTIGVDHFIIPITHSVHNPYLGTNRIIGKNNYLKD